MCLLANKIVSCINISGVNPGPEVESQSFLLPFVFWFEAPSYVVYNL